MGNKINFIHKRLSEDSLQAAFPFLAANSFEVYSDCRIFPENKVDKPSESVYNNRIKGVTRGIDKGVDSHKENKVGPKLSPFLLKRLYAAEASGIYDETLLDDVEIRLYLRCQSIVMIRRGQYFCLVCGELQSMANADASGVNVCAHCEKHLHVRRIPLQLSPPGFRTGPSGYAL